MNRKDFLSIAAGLFTTAGNWKNMNSLNTDVLHFKDDGVIPNSKFPLLVYHYVFHERGDRGAEWLEKRFLSNNWSNSWRNGIFTFQHYHSITHEVLGIYSGEALVLLGGEQGKKVMVRAGDIIIIPAGVGHQNLEEKDLGVVGAYPNGMEVDIMKGIIGERPKADENIAAVPFPDNDPLFGKSDGLVKLWSEFK